MLRATFRLLKAPCILNGNRNNSAISGGLLKPGTRDPGSAGIGWDPVPGFSIWHYWIPGPRG